MSSFYFFAILLLFNFSFAQTYREILLGPFPMDYSRNKALISLAENLTKDPKYHCTAIVQTHDLPLWERTNCNLVIWRNHLPIKHLKERYDAALHMPLLERTKEEIADAVGFLHEYLESELLKELSKTNFDMIICDGQSLPCLITGAVLKIERTINFSPICPPAWSSVYDKHASYIPTLYSGFDNHMSFSQRITNALTNQANNVKENLVTFMIGVKLLKKGMLRYLIRLLRTRDELYMAQCVTGFNYPEYHPPNVIDIGALFARQPHPLSTTIFNFMIKFNTVVYFGLGQLEKCVNITSVLASFRKLSETGFVIASDDLLNTTLDELFPYNIIYVSPELANDILAHPKVSVSINYGKWDEILQSLYHEIPVLSVGSDYDRGTNGKLIEFHEVGISMANECDVGSETFLQNINKLLVQAKYKRNAGKIADLMRTKNANETVKAWVDYYFTYGISELVPHGYFQKGSIRFDRLIAALQPVFAALLALFGLFYSARKTKRLIFGRAHNNLSSK